MNTTIGEISIVPKFGKICRIGFRMGFVRRYRKLPIKTTKRLRGFMILKTQSQEKTTLAIKI